MRAFCFFTLMFSPLDIFTIVQCGLAPRLFGFGDVHTADAALGKDMYQH